MAAAMHGHGADGPPPKPLRRTGAAAAHHLVKSTPILDISVPAPSVMATVNHESYCASGLKVQKAGLVPPTSAPKGGSTLNTGGSASGTSSSPLRTQADTAVSSPTVWLADWLPAATTRQLACVHGVGVSTCVLQAGDTRGRRQWARTTARRHSPPHRPA
jgi:hypothetical protein